MLVDLVYPADVHLETKRLELSEIEVQVLLSSKKIGSQKHYYTVDEFIFEDTSSGSVLTVKLKF
ncbi:hypothetical protein [Rummeliibacillus sp. TYF-LIM-RU47]|uniref:hypothetical protein n=1 Tax=Rummeliibacillus sp. TYF-LIM-RU47 TaxID=2608406 RepID=UPI00123B8CD0|nr:hypothetical protein [Rummeliibacillus sp. TYF-LIM-RU47]